VTVLQRGRDIRGSAPESLAVRRTGHYIARAGLRGARAIIPGALSILSGAVPDRARGSGHMAPTYFRREPGIERSNGQAAPHSVTGFLARCEFGAVTAARIAGILLTWL